MKYWLQIQQYLDIKSGAVLGMWSLSVIGMCIYSVIMRAEISTQVAILYGVAVGAYTYSKRKKNNADDKAEVDSGSSFGTGDTRSDFKNFLQAPKAGRSKRNGPGSKGGRA